MTFRTMKNVPFDGILTSEQIRMIMKVAEQRSFSKAAMALGVQQPAVTQQVRRLKERLSCRMFERGGNGVSLTRSGEAVLIYARAMTTLGADLIRQLRHHSEDTLLRIGLNEDFARTALPAVIGLFLRDFPNFRISATCGIGKRLFADLDHGDLDVVVTRVANGDERGRALCTVETAWIGRQDLAALSHDPIPLVLPTEGPHREGILRTLREASHVWRVVFESGSLAALEAAIVAGLGIGAFTKGLRLHDIGELDAAALGLPRLPDARFIVDRGHSRSIVADAFCTALQSAAAMSFSVPAGTGGGHDDAAGQSP